MLHLQHQFLILGPAVTGSVSGPALGTNLNQLGGKGLSEKLKFSASLDRLCETLYVTELLKTPRVKAPRGEPETLPQTVQLNDTCPLMASCLIQLSTSNQTSAAHWLWASSCFINEPTTTCFLPSRAASISVFWSFITQTFRRWPPCFYVYGADVTFTCSTHFPARGKVVANLSLMKCTQQGFVMSRENKSF